MLCLNVDGVLPAQHLDERRVRREGLPRIVRLERRNVEEFCRPARHALDRHDALSGGLGTSETRTAAFHALREFGEPLGLALEPVREVRDFRPAGGMDAADEKCDGDRAAVHLPSSAG